MDCLYGAMRINPAWFFARRVSTSNIDVKFASLHRCLLTRVCFPRHTHDLVDQVFSRISAMLSRNMCFTREGFAKIIKEAYTPFPRMIRLEDVIDIQTWIEPFLVEKITGMKNSLQFLITKDDSSPSLTKVRSKPDSGSTAYEDTNLLRGLPDTKPMFKAGRPLFHRHGGTAEQAVKDYDIFEAQVRKLFLTKNFYDFQVKSWEKLFEDIKKWESKQAVEYPHWWPLNKIEASNLFGGEGTPEPTEEGESSVWQGLLVILLTSTPLCMQSCSKDKSKWPASSVPAMPSTYTIRGEGLGQERRPTTATSSHKTPSKETSLSSMLGTEDKMPTKTCTLESGTRPTK